MRRNKRLASSVLALGLVLGTTLVAPVTSAKADTSAQATETVPFKVENRDDFNGKLITNADKAVTGTISLSQAEKKATTTYFKFTMPQDGIATLHFSMTDNAEKGLFLDSLWNVYADANCSIAVTKEVKLSESGFEETRVQLAKGTYYVKCSGTAISYYDTNNTVGLAVGYIPTKGKSDDFTVKKSSTKTTTDNVKLTVKTVDPDAKVYAMQGASAANLVGNSFHWKEDFNITGESYTVSENGQYTVMVIDSLGNFDQKVIKVNNIDKKRPTSATATEFKAGTTKVVGKAEAGTLVTATIGSKNYTAVARDNGVFTIKTSKLSKGNKIVLQAQDAAGNKSDKKTVTVK